VVTTNPVVTTLLAAWWFGERLNRRIAAGMAIATAGALVVITHGRPWTLLAGGIGLGELLLLGCVATWVGYTLIGKRLLTGIDPLTTTAVTAGIGLVLLLSAALLFEGPQALAAPMHATASVWVAMAFRRRRHGAGLRLVLRGRVGARRRRGIGLHHAGADLRCPVRGPAPRRTDRHVHGAGRLPGRRGPGRDEPGPPAVGLKAKKGALASARIPKEIEP
jgi:uncharacterized membrane protein